MAQHDWSRATRKSPSAEMVALVNIACSIGGTIRKDETFRITGYDRVSHTVYAERGQFRHYRFNADDNEWGHEYVESN